MPSRAVAAAAAISPVRRFADNQTVTLASAPTVIDYVSPAVLVEVVVAPIPNGRRSSLRCHCFAAGLVLRRRRELVAVWPGHDQRRFAGSIMALVVFSAMAATGGTVVLALVTAGCEICFCRCDNCRVSAPLGLGAGCPTVVPNARDARA